MNELLKVETYNNQITVLARDLHKFLEVGTDFRHWFPRMTEYGFVEGTDFNPVKKDRVQIEGSRNVERKVQDYQLTIDMAKQLSMIQRNEKGKQARMYFIEVEKAWNTPEKIMARALEIAQKEISTLNVQIEMQKPKVEFFDAVANSKTAIQIGDVAKVLDIKGVGRNKLFEILRKEKILMNDNLPYQTYIDRGYFRVIEQKYNVRDEVRINFKTLVYQRGVNFIRKKVEDHQNHVLGK